MAILRHKFLLLSVLSIPAGALLLKVYLRDHPLSAPKTRTITTTETLSPTSALSSSLHKTVNPRKHIQTVDSRSIYLSKREIGNLSDEEILAKFLKGFFGGWIFTPERKLIASLKGAGMKFIPVGFSDIEPQGPVLSSLSDFSRETLPPSHTLLFHGNFLILDHQTNRPAQPDLKSSLSAPSFLEVGFGDNRKRFAGMHRFEVSRSRDEDGKEDEGVVLCFSSVSCNPTENKIPFSKWVLGLHKFYAQCLFRDGIREVLKKVEDDEYRRPVEGKHL